MCHRENRQCGPGDRLNSDPSESPRIRVDAPPISKCTRRFDFGEDPLDGDSDLFRVRGAVGEGNRGPGNVGIGNVLLGLVASGEEPRLGMMNRWCGMC